LCEITAFFYVAVTWTLELHVKALRYGGAVAVLPHRKTIFLQRSSERDISQCSAVLKKGRKKSVLHYGLQITYLFIKVKNLYWDTGT